MNPILKVQEAWKEGARELGIEFVYPFSLGTGTDTVQFHGMIPGFGSPQGTVFLASMTFQEDVTTARRVARGSGYFFSFISAAVYGRFDRARFSETLKDWGWQNLEVIPPQGFAPPIKTQKKRPNKTPQANRSPGARL